MLFRFEKLLVFTLFSFLVFSCVSPQVKQNDFYLGLLNESNSEKVKLFENALTGPNKYIRQAAADELAVLLWQGIKISNKTIERIRLEASSWWVSAFDVVTPASGESEPNKKKVLYFLLNHESGTTSNEARYFALSELAKYKGFFTESEMAAIDGHFAVSQLQYRDGLDYFRFFQIDDIDDNGNVKGKKWTEQIPEIFKEYPNLINDLGRAFQYTATGSEGLVLFQRWEADLSNDFDDMRFRLLFYAGRIARRIGSSQNALGITLFERALSLAPDAEQQDACIWYVLDLSLTGPINTTFDRLDKYVPQWHNHGYYNGIMERFLHRLVTARDWRRVIRTYDLIKDTNAVVPKTGYAYIIGRAIQEGYLTAEDRRLAAAAANINSADANSFLRIAYNNSNVLIMPAMFYRMRTADALGLPFLIYKDGKTPIDPEEEKPEDSPQLQFLLGFFEYGAEDFSYRYIRLLDKELNPGELQAVACALDNAGMYPQSMGITMLYINRAGYIRDRRDLELMYPRPFLELIENRAQEFDIEPSLFFGLVRTESAFQSAIVSRAGAVGLSQLMPATAREQATRIRRGGGPDFFCSDNNIDSTNPDLNVYIGAFYLNYLRGRLGDMYLALMAYNGGQNRVRRWRNANNMPIDLFLETVPIYETRDYGKRVTVIGRIYKELYYKDE